MIYQKTFFASKYELEFERKKQIILGLIASEALRGHVYIPSCFAQCHEDFAGLGSWETILRHINNYARKGWIKYNFNFNAYGLRKPDYLRGYLCVRGMRFKTTQRSYNQRTGKMEHIINPFYPNTL